MQMDQQGTLDTGCAPKQTFSLTLHIKGSDLTTLVATRNLSSPSIACNRQRHVRLGALEKGPLCQGS
jgi:hypothetical protein